MLNTDNDCGGQNHDSQQLCPSDRSFHGDAAYPFIEEFSEFLASVSTKALKTQLMTQQQRNLAKAMWEAENYGGSEHKCTERLKDLYGPKWYQVTTVADHFIPEREYCEYILLLEHQRQWQQQHQKRKIQQKQP